jgi:hypothetical protein
MGQINFRLGQKIRGYLTDGMPFDGYIIGFAGEKKKYGPLARVKFYNSKETGLAVLNSCHPMEVEKITHKKNTFLAAASRVSPILHFKNTKAQRDFLEAFWQELCDFTEKD